MTLMGNEGYLFGELNKLSSFFTRWHVWHDLGKSFDLIELSDFFCTAF